MRRRGCKVHIIDIIHGPQHDLTRRRIQRALIRNLHRRKVVGAVLATPCQSFSIARRGPPPTARGPPPPLRSRECLWGLPHLNEKDQERVRIGNSLARFTARYARECLKLGIPFIIENPRSSRLWLLPPMQALMNCRDVEVVDVDFCMMGTRWKKPTRLVIGHGEPQAIAKMRGMKCHGRGICSRTQQPHQQLTGTSPNGQFWTLIAQPYPQQLCVLMSQVVCRLSVPPSSHP